MLASNDYAKGDVVRALTSGAKYELPDRRDPQSRPPCIVIAKLLIGGMLEDGLDDPRLVKTYFAMSLRHIVKIIRKRVEDDYKTRKQGDWNHFPGDLIQFLIWEKEQMRP